MTIFTLLSPHAWAATPPQELPIPGERWFAPALPDSVLPAGTIAEAYSLSLSRPGPDFVTLIKVTARHPDGSLIVSYVTYSRQCT
jgi:hypothetical protein